MCPQPLGSSREFCSTAIKCHWSPLPSCIISCSLCCLFTTPAARLTQKLFCPELLPIWLCTNPHHHHHHHPPHTLVQRGEKLQMWKKCFTEQQRLLSRLCLAIKRCKRSMVNSITAFLPIPFNICRVPKYPEFAKKHFFRESSNWETACNHLSSPLTFSRYFPQDF